VPGARRSHACSPAPTRDLQPGRRGLSSPLSRELCAGLRERSQVPRMWWRRSSALDLRAPGDASGLRLAAAHRLLSGGGPAFPSTPQLLPAVSEHGRHACVAFSPLSLTAGKPDSICLSVHSFSFSHQKPRCPDPACVLPLPPRQGRVRREELGNGPV